MLPIAKTICLSVHPGNFLGSNVAIHLSVCPHQRSHNVMKWHTIYLASMGCNLILHIHVMVNNFDSCQNRVSAEQYHMTILPAQG